MIASLNVNSLIPHLDEIEVVMIVHGIHFLAKITGEFNCESITLLIPGFLDHCSTRGEGTRCSLCKVANIADMRTKLSTMVYSNKIYTIGYFFIFHYIHDVTVTS